MTPIFRTSSTPTQQVPLAGVDSEHMAFLAERRRRLGAADEQPRRRWFSLWRRS